MVVLHLNALVYLILVYLIAAVENLKQNVGHVVHAFTLIMKDI